jgi:hypothetical protein
MPGRRPLTPDVRAQVRLHARVGVARAGIHRGTVTRAAAVAELGLIPPPGRPDLIDDVARALEHPGLPHPTHGAFPAEREAELALLRAARRVTVGDVALVGPGGVRVAVVRMSMGRGTQPRPMLELRRRGVVVGWYATADELAERGHVDLALLVEELPPPAGAGP